MRLAAAKLPVTTEVIDKTTPPRIGRAEVDEVEEAPRVITKGQLQALAENPSAGAEAVV